MAKKLEDLLPSDEVVVELDARSAESNGKLITIEKARQVVMTKAGFDEIEKDGDGHATTLGRKVKLLGIPVYETVNGRTGPVQAATKVEKLAKSAKVNGADSTEATA